MINNLSKLLTILVLAGCGSIVNASVTLQYEGNNFTGTSLLGPTTPTDIYTTADSVSGRIELSDALSPNLSVQEVTPLSFNFSDGVNSINNTNATISVFWFSTDATGLITAWAINTKDVSVGHIWQIATSYGMTVTTGDSTHVDTGEDTLCGPGSTATSCVLSGDPYYFQGALVTNSPGAWSVVPIPATVWLFGSGLLGLVGMARRRKAA